MLGRSTEYLRAQSRRESAARTKELASCEIIGSAIAPFCKVERHLAATLGEPPGADQFEMFAATQETLASFNCVSRLVQHLHAQRDGEERQPSGERDFDGFDPIIEVSIRSGAESVGVDAGFIPAIHRTYSEVKAWFRELPADDISQ